MRLNTGFTCNAVIWLRSLPDQDFGVSRRVVEDVRPIVRGAGYAFEEFDISNKSEFKEFIREAAIAIKCSGVRPIIHVDMHGSVENGLSIASSGESISWAELCPMLQVLNVCSGNNLCVIATTCFALRAILPMNISRPVPFFALLAPEEEVQNWFIEQNIVGFYSDLVSTGQLDWPYWKHLSGGLKYFHCEKMLFIVVARYIRDACHGKGWRERKEMLLTEVLSQGMERTKENMSRVRSLLKSGLVPSDALLDRYSNQFLIGKRCSFTIDDLYAELGIERA